MSLEQPGATIATYVAARPKYEALAVRLTSLLQDLIAEAGVDIAHFEARAKSIESFTEKIQRDGKEYSDPLRDVTDLCGVRIILYTKDDLDRVAEIIRSEFAIDEANSIDKAETLDPDRFGYLSVHYVVTLAPARTRLTEWKAYAGLKAEIQVRTILQHAWSVIDHKLRYKSTAEVPRELRRQLFRLSALLELADTEFLDIRSHATALSETYAKDVEQGQLDIDLNLDSLRAFVAESPIIRRLTRTALEAGYRPHAQLAALDEEGRQRAQSKMFGILQAINISRLQQLQENLEAAEPTAEQHLRALREHTEAAGFVPTAVPEDVAVFVLLSEMSSSVTSDLLKASRYRPQIQSYFRALSGIPESVAESGDETGKKPASRPQPKTARRGTPQKRT